MASKPPKASGVFCLTTINNLMGFKTFWEDQSFVDCVLREFNEQPALHNPFQKQKTWSAKKQEIVQTWQQLRPDMPIVITPIDNMSADHQSYGEDGIRITGSWQFISSVLGRLKELISYENPQTKLRLVLRAVEPKEGVPQNMTDRPAYVFYLNVERRGRGKAGRPGKLI